MVGIFEPKELKKQDKEILRKAEIVLFTECVRVRKSRGIKIRTNV
jgi:hypothetical protein